MHTVLTRGNATVAYTLSVLAGLTFCCFISTVFLDYRVTSYINTAKILVKNVPDYGASREKHDLGFITFDLEANLTTLFNWNVKQLFLFLTAEYKTPDNELNQVVLWDKIVRRGDIAALNFKNLNTKYYFWDDGNGLRNNHNITLFLSWNIIPNAGLLPTMKSLNSHMFKFPAEYASALI
ncbi:signal peptidase complex subunit 3 [Stomoxys calcitrans]|uniref:Signal peptidase complex subunit 3 n=1 Tax=Stomoxys calcitrans TaxID=35570 RepID=A0A1I8PFR4_STOCA|nr:signal peptidase complex subunit 3 [Stomoxys calcitrans]